MVDAEESGSVDERSVGGDERIWEWGTGIEATWSCSDFLSDSASYAYLPSFCGLGPYENEQES